MKQVNSFLIAFSMYSRIPVPQPDWEHSSMDYVMCYFPFVGTVMGGLAWPAAREACPWAVRLFAGGHPDGPAPLDLRRHPHGRVHGHKGCPGFLRRQGEKTGHLKGQPHRRLCGHGVRSVSGPLLWRLVCAGAGKGACLRLPGIHGEPDVERSVGALLPQGKEERSYVTMFAEKARKRRAVLFLALLLTLEGALLLCLGGWRAG